MKDIIQDQKLNIDSEVAEVSNIKELKLLRRDLLKTGMTLWECNLVTQTIVSAVYEEVVASLEGKVHRKLIRDEKCVYIQALNKKNAKKKFEKKLIELYNYIRNSKRISNA